MNKLTKESPITLVELPPSLFGEFDGDASCDIFSHARLPARAIHTLEGVLRADGWKNVRSINPLYHGRKGRLNEENKRRIYNSDVLLVSSITRTSPQSLELIKRARNSKKDMIIISGGPDATFVPKPYLENGDIVVKGEGEKTLRELMKRLGSDPGSLEDIDGLAFRRNEQIEVTNPRALMTSEELSKLPHPFYDNAIRSKAIAVVETSRGCPNDCDFCGVTAFYGRKYRMKDIDYVVEGMEQTRDMKRAIFFIDDNFIASPGRAIELLGAIRERKLHNNYGIAQVTIKAADNPRLLEELKKTNIRALCVGIESINDKSLDSLGKPYNAEQNKRAINILREEGFWVHGMMMAGADGDTPESLRETSNWIGKNLDSVQIFAPIPLPGTRFYDRMNGEGRILSREGSLYDGQHVIVRPKNMTPYKLQRIINEMYEGFYSLRRGLPRLVNSKWKVINLGILAYAQFNGLRRTLYDPQSKKHLEFLRSVS